MKACGATGRNSGSCASSRLGIRTDLAFSKKSECTVSRDGQTCGWIEKPSAQSSGPHR